MTVVVTLLSYGCPLQAIVRAFALDERTVAAWQKRAGEQCQRVHTELMEAGKVKSQHIQADAHTSKRQEAHCVDSVGDGCDHPSLVGRNREPASRSHPH